MFSYLIDTDYPYDQNPYFNNRRRRYYNPHQFYVYSFPCYTHPLPFSSFHTPQDRHFRESYYDPENIVNFVSGLNQNHEEKNHHDKEQKRNGYRRIKIFGPDDEPENKYENEHENKHKNNNTFTKQQNNNAFTKQQNNNTFTKQQAAKKIYNFLKHQPSTHRTRKILVRLLHLRNLQNLLNSLSSQNQSFGTLTFTSKGAGKQIFPISENNKMFLIQEDSILKILDQLDKVQSEGNEIVRDRRKEIVKIAQKMLEELDAEKDRQWKWFCDELENSESVVNENSESVVNENSESIENENNERIENENSESIENIDNTEDIVINNDVIEKNDGEKDKVNEEVTDDAIIETIDDDKEDVITYEVIDTLNNSSEAEEIKPYTILSQDDVNIENKTKDTKSIHTRDDENDFDFIDNTVFDSNSSTNLNDNETMDARNVEESNEAALTHIKKQSQNEQAITSPMEGVENINVTNEENDDEFVIVNTSN